MSSNVLYPLFRGCFTQINYGYKRELGESEIFGVLIYARVIVKSGVWVN